MSGRSRIVFTMPSSIDSLPYKLEDVLNAFSTWPMRLDVGAVPDRENFSFQVEGDLYFSQWLKVLTDSPVWKAISSLLASERDLDKLSSEVAITDIKNSKSKPVEKELLSSDTRGLIKEITRRTQVQLDKLVEQYPQLRGKIGKASDITALSIVAMEALSKIDAKCDINVIRMIPILPLILLPRAPPWNVTALELPYRVILSPLLPSSWVHSKKLVTHQGRTELWHTRLTAAQDEVGPDTPTKVRAIWSPDYPSGADISSEKPFLMSLSAWDRQKLVINMAGFHDISDGVPYNPISSQSRRLHLSSLGALLDVEGSWETLPDSSDILKWRHLTTLGRDQYVRVVYMGFLCPFGHAAALVKLTERKFESHNNDPNKRIAVLRQRTFLQVLEGKKHYDGSNHPIGGKNFPFRTVEIITQVTPDLSTRGEGASHLEEIGETIYEDQVQPENVFWPVVHGRDVLFDIAATDINGNRITFSMPLLFIGKFGNQLKSERIIAAYNANNESRRYAEIGGMTVCFAPRKLETDDDPKGDPQLPTKKIVFNASGVIIKSNTRPNFYPQIQKANVGIRPLQKLLQQPDAVTAMEYADIYLQHGFDSPNIGEIFFKTLALDGLPLTFGEGVNEPKSDMLGALVTPSMNIKGLSRVMGPAGDITEIVNGNFNPTTFFEGAKIIGGVELTDILDVVTSLVGDDVPKMLSRELPDRVEASFDWTTGINKSDPLNLFIPNADLDGDSTQLVMKSFITTPLENPNETNYEAKAELNNFKINLFGFIIIWVEDLKFVSKKGKKSDVTVDLRRGQEAVQFGGPLEFVNELRNIIPFNGFSDPPNISVTPSGIAASYSLNLPSINIGIFTLSNISLGAGFNLPFDSRPASVRFNFSERQNPFSLTVSMLGGGGFFAIAVSTQGVQEIEAALEFGAAVAIDFGVASGGVEIKAGIYFHWLQTQDDHGSVELAGYVRLHGELSILGLISASLTFNLVLSYEKITTGATGESKVWGEATLVIEIEILFFSIDVSVTCRREFAGSESDPKFIDLIPDQSIWDDYCDAFAEEVV